MNLRPLADFLIVEPTDPIKQTESGILLAKSIEPDRAKVLAHGPDVEDVRVGDLLLIDWNKTDKVADKTYRISLKDVIGVFEE